MSTSSAGYYPIDPELPQRQSYTSTSENSHGSHEQDHSLANLIQAVNSTTQQEHTTTPPQTSPRKRKHGEDELQSSASTEKRFRLDIDVPPPHLSGPLPLGTDLGDNAGADPSLALFRKSNRAPAKKYTRPPTKDVFQSLKISPEEWVRLEAEAKAYMLDRTRPERQACVGVRNNNGTTNDTKIQLFKTVQVFLADSAGSRYFGVTDYPVPGCRWVYPRDEDRLIGLLTPLMRRMVTNERQRQYARRTRASGGGTRGAEPEQQHFENPAHEDASQDQVMHDESHSTTSVSALPQSRIKTPAAEPTNYPQPTFLAENCIECVFLIDNAIAFRYIISTPKIEYSELIEQLRDQILRYKQNRLANTPPVPDASSDPVQPDHDYDKNAATLSNSQTAENPGSDIQQAAYEAHRAALSKVAIAATAQVCPTFEVQGHGPRGLQDVRSAEDWNGLRNEVAETVWMLGYLKFVIRVRDGEEE